MFFPQSTQDQKTEDGWEISPQFVRAVCDRFITIHKDGQATPRIEIIPGDVHDLLLVIEEAMYWWRELR